MSNDSSQEGVREDADYFAFKPGQRLQKAREVRGLSVEQVARELRLSQRFVVAMEADDYKQLPEPAFVRGYMRRYAQLVKLSPDDIAARFDECYAADGSTPEVDARPRNPIQLLGDVARPRLRVSRLLSWASLALIIVLLAGFLFWNHSSRREPAPVEVPAAPAVTPAPAAVPVPDAAAPVAIPVPVPATPAAAAPGMLPPPSGPAVLPAPVGAQSSPALPAAPPAQAAAPAPAAVTADTLVLTLKGDSWISVRDAAGRDLMSALRKSGETLTLSGQAPFAVNVGNAPAVAVTINGRAVDLRSHMQGVVASLTINR